ncbi:MAG TPA: hypothetical protein ENL23_00580 [Candidatus Acetothermia bacterium]|nr:hypothetical protein [Candidatus Acetothermia bacterium]
MGNTKRVHSLVRVSVRVYTLLFLLCVICAMSASCRQATGSESLLRLSVVYLPDNMEYIAPKLSEEARTLAVSARPQGGGDADTALLMYALVGDTVKSVMSLPAPQNRIGATEGLPLLILSDQSVLLTHSDWTKEARDYRQRVHYSILDTDTGEERDITPRNLDKTTPWLCKAGPPFLWSEEQGFAFFIPEESERTIHVWQGKENLRETESRSRVLGIGKAYLSGRLTAILVTVDGHAFAYDYQSGHFVESAIFAGISGRLSDIAAGIDKWPFTFVMSRGLVAYRHKVGSDNVIRVLDGDGHVQDFVKRSVIQRKPDGSLRDPAEVEALNEGEAPLYSEGKQLTLDFISTRTSPIPLDETRLGLLDVLYARFIVIGPS